MKLWKLITAIALMSFLFIPQLASADGFYPSPIATVAYSELIIIDNAVDVKTDKVAKIDYRQIILNTETIKNTSGNQKFIQSMKSQPTHAHALAKNEVGWTIT